MPNAFVYTPFNANNNAWQTTGYHWDQPQQHSPFVPPGEISPSPFGSPYSGSSPLPGSGTPVWGSVPFPSSGAPSPNSQQFPGFGTTNTWDYNPRPRRSSWQGYENPYPNSPPMSGGYLAAESPADAYYRERRHSFGTGFTAPPWLTANATWNPTSWGTAFQNYDVNPILDGTRPLQDFVFDLAATDFRPERVEVEPYSGRRIMIPLGANELSQTAFRPSRTRLRIVCELIPNWPIDIVFEPRSANSFTGDPLPMNVGDVLQAIHRNLRRIVSRSEWNVLPASITTPVGECFWKRVKHYGGKTGAEAEASHGVKHVDFLMGRVWFRGLVPVPGQPDIMKMVVA